MLLKQSQVSSGWGLADAVHKPSVDQRVPIITKLSKSRFFSFNKLANSTSFNQVQLDLTSL